MGIGHVMGRGGWKQKSSKTKQMSAEPPASTCNILGSHEVAETVAVVS